MTESELTEVMSGVIIRSQKLSYLLGIATGGLFEIIDSGNLSEEQKKPLRKILESLSEGIYDVIYKKEVYDKKETT